MTAPLEVGDVSGVVLVSFAGSCTSGVAFKVLGFVMGMADFVTVREAIALARAR